MERLLPPTLVFSQFTRYLDQWKVHGGLVLFYGDQAVLTYSLQAIAPLLANGEHVVFVDSANAFNPFVIAEVATHMNRPPEELLDRLHISRTFTVHQLEALIAERIRSALTTYASRVLIASGFLHNFYDEDVVLQEAWRVFRKAVAHLRALADSGTLVLVICPTRSVRLPDRERMMEVLIAQADTVMKLEASTLSLEKPVKTGPALSMETSTTVRPRRGFHGKNATDL
jgi:hypothetical protein